MLRSGLRTLRLVATLAVTVLVAGALIGTLWWNLHGARQFDERMRDAVLDATGFELDADSNLRLIQLSPLTLSLERLRLSEPRKPGTVFTAESVHVVVKTLPLLRGATVELESVEISRPTLAVVQRRDGSTNLDGLLRERHHAPDGVSVSLERFSLREGAVSLLDERSGKAFALDGLQFNAGPLAREASGTSELRGEFLAPGAAGLKIHLKGQHELRLAEQVYRLQSVAGSVDSGEIKAELGAEALTWEGRHKRLEIAAPSVKGRTPGGAAAAFAVQAGSVKVRAGGAHAEGVSAQLRLRTDSGEGHLQLAPTAVQWKGEQLLLPEAAITADFAARDGKLHAVLQTPLALKPADWAVTASPLRAELTLEHPRLKRELPVKLSGEVLARGLQAGSARLNGTLAGARLSSTARWESGGPTPVELQLQLARFDADAWIQPAQGSASTTLFADPQSLADLPVQGSLRVGELLWHGLWARGVRLALGKDAAGAAK